MAQYAKDEIRQRIVEAARKEFLRSGYEKASIRTIAEKSRTAKSNLYNYFKDKDGLFQSVLGPTVAKIRAGLELAKQFNVPKGVGDYTLESQSFVVGVVNRFVEENFTDVRLLLFKAQGSRLEGFKGEVLEAFTDNMCAWVRSMKPGRKLSRLFVRSVCGFYMSLIEQAILFGNAEDMKGFQKEFTSFVYHGWKGVLQ
jgi:AcrR family transcriptional regulator